MNEWQIKLEFLVKLCVLIWGSGNMLISSRKWGIKRSQMDYLTSRLCSNSCSPISLLISVCFPLWTTLQGRKHIDPQIWIFQFAMQCIFCGKIRQRHSDLYICFPWLWSVWLNPQTPIDPINQKNWIAGRSLIKLRTDTPTKTPRSGGRPWLQSQPTSLLEVVRYFWPLGRGTLHHWGPWMEH